MTADDFGKETERAGILEGIATDEQRVEDDTKRPQVSCTTRVSRTAAQQHFGRHVRWVAVLPPNSVV